MKGFRNHYRASMPLPEKLSKDLLGLLGDAVRWLKNGGRLPRIITYPDYPSKKTTIYKIAKALGFRLSNKPLSTSEAVLFFEDKTTKSSAKDAFLRRQKRVLNLKCTDISKVKVDDVHQDIFKYNTFVDPATHQGKAVLKSDENAMHDGKIIECPQENLPADKVVQVVIDNTIDSTTVMDYRIALIGQQLPVAYKKFKSMEKRFTNDVHRSELIDLDSFFSEEEQKLILKFAEAMELDFAEFDVLRDNVSGKMYIIDVNTTPYGPPAELPAADRSKAVQALSKAFHDLISTTEN
jgi:hypothetical protein